MSSLALSLVFRSLILYFSLIKSLGSISAMIQFVSIPLRKSINQAYLKIKPFREDYEVFKQELTKLLALINDKESEEHNKAFVRDFLKNTFYADKYVNTKERTDLVIHLEKSSASKAGVLIETKSPVNRSDMISEENLNCKAMHEVILYYLRERIDLNNDEIKHIIITNAYEWFIFNSDQFEKNIYKTSLKDEYEKWKGNLKVSSNNDFFYGKTKEFLNDEDAYIEGVHFNLRSFKDDYEKSLIPLFKIFSPAELLKEPFANDSNTLNKEFYLELLHIIGLEEKKEGSKRVIQRKEPKKRDDGSLLENTIRILKSEDLYKQINNLRHFGENEDERLFNIGLELNITWINRILFLKLLEAQLVNYHKGDPQFRFLQSKIISQYDDLHELFHEVLAKKINERNKDLIDKFKNVPYLNSSLFDISELEKETIRISGLKDRFDLPFYNHTIFSKEIKSKGKLPALEYLLRFLDAFDFASEGGEEIQEERKTIINASVLGLIFEKINGYKEGSFYTPGFITMYMARETLRRAVVQKFNEAEKTDYKDYDELRKNIDTSSTGREEANKIINGLKICDPAVGSGHFLVSCLNEIIAIKADLRILNDREGRQVRDFRFVIENDELVITDEVNDELFSYYLNPGGKPVTRLQELQETLFHEKETIIENCLFGVDINNNSVNICRLRLWIELLKNAYYDLKTHFPNKEKGSDEVPELITLPNIDINIKQGNSLISRFDIKQDMFSSGDKQTLDVYKINVELYKDEQDKTKRKELKDSIEKTKNRFKGIAVDPLKKERNQLEKLTSQLYDMSQEGFLTHEYTEKHKKEIEKKRKTLSEKINKLSKEIEEKTEEYRTIYSNSFEWRFEFPEVLDEEGNFEGFDVVIGNPPWGDYFKNMEKNFLKNNFVEIDSSTPNAFAYFIGLSKRIVNINAAIVLPDSFLLKDFEKTRVLIKEGLLNIDWYQNTSINEKYRAFKDVEHDVCIIIYDLNSHGNLKCHTYSYINSKIEEHNWITQKSNMILPEFNNIYNLLIKEVDYKIKQKFDTYDLIGDILQCHEGIHSGNVREKLFTKKKDKNSKPLFVGAKNGDIIENYYSSRSGWFVNYDKDLIKKDDGDYASLRDETIFTSPKIYITRTGDPFKAFYDKDCYASNNFFSLQFINYNENTEKNLKSVLCIINSKFSQYYIRNIVAPRLGKTYVETKIIHLLKIPVPSFTDNIKNLLVNLIDSILKKKEQNPGADTTKLEEQIDQMVYKLYGLTEEEIKIIEEKR